MIIGLKVTDGSMLPRFFPGDIVHVDPLRQCENGDYCAVLVGGKGIVRTYWQEGRKTFLKATDDDYPNIIVRRRRDAHSIIIGRVVCLEREFHNFNDPGASGWESKGRT